LQHIERRHPELNNPKVANSNGGIIREEVEEEEEEREDVTSVAETENIASKNRMSQSGPFSTPKDVKPQKERELRRTRSNSSSGRSSAERKTNKKTVDARVARPKSESRVPRISNVQTSFSELSTKSSEIINTNSVEEDEFDEIERELENELKKSGLEYLMQRPVSRSNRQQQGDNSGQKQPPKNISEKMILFHYGDEEERLENVREVILRDLSLTSFSGNKDFDVDRMDRLEVLSLSHNYLTELSGVGSCTNLLELNLNFNQIEHLGPLENCLSLRKLWVSNNKIRTLFPLKPLKELSVLSVFKNIINDFDNSLQVLRELPVLEELDIEENPCCSQFGYNYILLHHLSLKVLNTKKVGELDYDLANHYSKEYESQLKKLNSDGLEASSLGSSTVQRPGTAPIGRSRAMSRLKELREKRHEEEPIEEANQVDRLVLDDNGDEIDSFEQDQGKRIEDELVRVIEERDKLKEQLRDAQNIKSDDSELLQLRMEVKNMYAIVEENNDLKRRIELLESDQNEDEKIRNLRTENNRLRFDIGGMMVKLQAEKDKNKKLQEARIQPLPDYELRFDTKASGQGNQMVQEEQNTDSTSVSVNIEEIKPRPSTSSGIIRSTTHLIDSDESDEELKELIQQNAAGIRELRDQISDLQLEVEVEPRPQTSFVRSSTTGGGITSGPTFAIGGSGNGSTPKSSALPQIRSKAAKPKVGGSKFQYDSSEAPRSRILR